ncbi:MAG: hypothetical protein ACR2QK_19540, partial [Acidimicrobiales bacterium]
MTVRRDRVVRVAKVASEHEAMAKAVLVEADRKVQILDRRRESALTRAGELSDPTMPVGLRSHLVGAGARHLV